MPASPGQDGTSSRQRMEAAQLNLQDGIHAPKEVDEVFNKIIGVGSSCNLFLSNIYSLWDAIGGYGGIKDLNTTN